jgi:hypothetical protein
LVAHLINDPHINSDDNGRVIKRIAGTYDPKATRIGKKVPARSGDSGWVAFKLSQRWYPGVRIECTDESGANAQVLVTYSLGVSHHL